MVEFLIVIAIMAIIMSMAVPAYRNVVYGAQVQTAISDLESISQKIDTHIAQTGDVPASLADLGLQGLVDPWDNPYQYLPLSIPGADLADVDVTGEKVIPSQEIADLALDPTAGRAASVRPDVNDVDNPSQTKDGRYRGKIKPGRTADLSTFINVNSSVPLTEIFVFMAKKSADLVPLNTDYDLFSPGPDGQTAANIADPAAEDDIIRAQNGKYIGPANNL
ncbi:MAG: hypothetical protein V3W41_16860 [Planctomycetota bacterium]